MKSPTDKAWEKYGRQDPYFGVLSHARFQAAALDGASREEFFISGRDHVERVLKKITSLFGDTARGSVLDFGCGVGRLAIPFAASYAGVTGLDVSESMLSEARRNGERKAVGNVQWVLADEGLTLASGPFDLVHSFIVFQHIRPDRGLEILRTLLTRLAPGGIGAVHFPWQAPVNRAHRIRRFFLNALPFLHIASNLAKGRPALYPRMEMNLYDCTRIFNLLHDLGCAEIHLEFVEDGGYLGFMAYFRKPVENRA